MSEDAILVVDRSPSATPNGGDGVETIHDHISCDACGWKPIRGTRYHSTRIIDYDICQSCYEENHQHLTLANAFVELRQATVVNEADYFHDPWALRASAHTWNDLVIELQRHPETQKLDVDLNLGPFEFGGSDENPRCGMVTRLLAGKVSLKSFYVEFPAGVGPEQEMAVAALLAGIAANPSIVTVHITFQFLSTVTVQALCGIVRDHPSIRFLFLEREGGSSGSWLHQDRDDAAPQSTWSVPHLDPKEVARQLFQALAETSLQAFVLEGISNLEDDCRSAVLHALRTRPSLKCIKANFQGQSEEVRQLLLAKKQNWMRDWSDPNATNESRLHILEEIKGCKRVEEQDQVAALFHFLRSNPGSVLELRE